MQGYDDLNWFLKGLVWFTNDSKEYTSNRYDFEENTNYKNTYLAEREKYTAVGGDKILGNLAMGSYMTRVYGDAVTYEVTAEAAAMSYTTNRINKSAITMMTHFQGSYKNAVKDLGRKNIGSNLSERTKIYVQK